MIRTETAWLPTTSNRRNLQEMPKVSNCSRHGATSRTPTVPKFFAANKPELCIRVVKAFPEAFHPVANATKGIAPLGERIPGETSAAGPLSGKHCVPLIADGKNISVMPVGQPRRSVRDNSGTPRTCHSRCVVKGLDTMAQKG